MGTLHSKDRDHGEKRRRKKTGTTLTTNAYTNSPESSNLNAPPASPPVPIPSTHQSPITHQPTITYDPVDTGNDNTKTQKFSPFYQRSTSTGQIPTTTVTHTTVSPVRHQVVLSDQVMPLSSLISISRHLRRSNSESARGNISKQQPQPQQQQQQQQQHHQSSSNNSINSSNTSLNKRLFNLHHKPNHKPNHNHPNNNRQDTDTTAFSDDGISSSRSAQCSNSSDSSLSGFTSPAGFWNRRLSLNTDNKSTPSPSSSNPVITKITSNVGGTSNSNTSTGSDQKSGLVVFDATISANDSLPSPPSSSSPHRQQDRQDQQPSPFVKSAWIYDYGHEKEYNRQLRQHYVLKQFFGKNIAVNLERPPQAILDSACGIGVWTWETSQQYPDSDVIGIDINLPDHHPGPWGSSGMSSNQGGNDDDGTSTFINSSKNISFNQGDILQRLPYDDAYFDFIHQREAGSFIPLDYWDSLLGEFHRVLKDGGRIQLVEHDIRFKNPGPVLTMINEWYRIAADGLGVRTDFIHLLEEKLIAAGFDQVQVSDYDIPIGEWSDDPVQKQHGFLYKEQIKGLFKSVQRWWLTESGITQQEYERVCLEAMDEFEEYNSSVLWKIVTGRKAPTP